MTLQASSELDAAIAVCRFGLGARPGELARAGSDPRGWLKAQITDKGADHPPGDLPSGRQQFVAYRSALTQFRGLKQAVASGGPAVVPNADGDPGATTLAASDAGVDAATAQLKAERRQLLRPIRQDVAAEVLARTRLGATTPATFRERWTLFWANHFTVSAAKAKAAPLAGPFEREAIRPHVFGRFEDLLVASSTHPGMLLYLDQPRSGGPNSEVGQRRELGLNENLACEIMELHSVGPDAGYTQADVTEFARALTGYSIGLQRDGPQSEGTGVFCPALHEPGARTVMGRTYAGAGPNRRARSCATWPPTRTPPSNWRARSAPTSLPTIHPRAGREPSPGSSGQPWRPVGGGGGPDRRPRGMEPPTRQVQAAL